MNKILDISEFMEKNEFTFSDKTDKIFSSNSRRHEDLKEMLDSSKDGLKLDAMKRVIGMIAKGKNASHLFPAVVKNVASKNLEKLVYVYLVRYAEEKPDLALLSISTFQKGLKDPNQLIRASALRVLSSIRVPMIAPIMMLAIKEGTRDMSTYVRKTAALALPKLYKLDSELKESLVDIIEYLLADRSTLVIGSAIMAFEIVCPEREDILKRIFSKMVRMFAAHFHHQHDSVNYHSSHTPNQGGGMDEWSICQILYTLTRFASRRLLTRPQPQISDTNILFPKVGDLQKCAKSENLIETGADVTESNKMVDATEPIHTTTVDIDNDIIDLPQNIIPSAILPSVAMQNSEDIRPKTFSDVHPDLKLLLKSCKYLLQSRNSAVVMSVVQLYYHCAPYEEIGIITKPLIRLLRSYGEVQCVVLKNIVSLCHNAEIKGLFEAHLKSFFVNHNDPTHIKLLKLEILTAIANESNIPIILRELQTYVTNQDKEFASATIVCIGQCAQNIPSIQQTCTNGLLNLMHSSNDRVVSESVIVLKNLLKLGDKQNTQNILYGMCKILVDSFANTTYSEQDPSFENYKEETLNGDEFHSQSGEQLNSYQDTRDTSNKLDSKAIACILWLLCQYGDQKTYVQTLPDLLRILAKHFTHQENIVKLQIISMAAKLYAFLLQHSETTLICHATKLTAGNNSNNNHHQLMLPKIETLIKYIFDLAKYDTNYDIRDKARFLRQLLFPYSSSTTTENGSSNLNGLSRNLLDYFGAIDNKRDKEKHLAEISEYAQVRHDNTFDYQLGTLSHYLKIRVEGYRDIRLPNPGKENNGLTYETLPSEHQIDFQDIDWWATEEDEHANVDDSSNYTSSIVDPYTSSVTTAVEALSEPNDLKDDKYDYEKFLGEEENDENNLSSSTSISDASSPPPQSRSQHSKNVKHEKFLETRNKNNINNGIVHPSPAAEESLDESDTSTTFSESSAGTSDEDRLETNFTRNKLKKKAEKSKDIQIHQKSKSKEILSGERNQTTNVIQSNSRIDELLSLDFTTPVNSPSSNLPLSFNTGGRSGAGGTEDLKSSSKYSKGDYGFNPVNSLMGGTTSRYSEVLPSHPNSPGYKKLIPLNNNNTSGQLNFFELQYRFTRKPHISNSHMVNVELKLRSHGIHEGFILTNIHIPLNALNKEQIQPFYEITKFIPDDSSRDIIANMGIDFRDSTQPVKFGLKYTVISMNDSSIPQTHNVDAADTKVVTEEYSIAAPFGEQIYPISMQTSDFINEQNKLTGMNETSQIIYPPSKQIILSDTSISSINSCKSFQTDTKLIEFLLQSFNFALVHSPPSLTTDRSNSISFTARTRSQSSLVLVQFQEILNASHDNNIQKLTVVKNNNPQLIVNSGGEGGGGGIKIRICSDKMIISNLFIKDIIAAINNFYSTNHP